MVPNPAHVDFCIENVACLGLAQQEALDAPSDRLVAHVLLDGEAVLGGNHALDETELLAGAVVAAKEREHSVEHGPDFVNLVELVHGLVVVAMIAENIFLNGNLLTHNPS